jgi:hypothetical protein
MARQIKDQRAVSEKYLKGYLNPEGSFGGEGKRWRRAWRHEESIAMKKQGRKPKGSRPMQQRTCRLLPEIAMSTLTHTRESKTPAASLREVTRHTPTWSPTRTTRNDCAVQMIFWRTRVANRPTTGVTTRRPEEPYVNSTSPVMGSSP